MKHVILNVEQTGTYVGRSPHTIRYWIKTGTGPKSFKMGKRRAFLAADLDAWIDQQRGATNGGGDAA